MRIEVELPEAAIEGQHGVYVAFDGVDEVLYIGRTQNLLARLNAHRSQSAWFRQMRRVEFTPCDGPHEARALEKSMIATFRPQANINDGGEQQRSARQRLPEWTVARLVEMYEECVAAGRANEAQNETLNVYIATLRAAGWTLGAIGEALTITREAVRQRQVKAPRIDSRAPVPPVPVKVKPLKKEACPRVPARTLAALLELKGQAEQVRGWTPLDSPLRAASERYTEMLAEQVLAGFRIGTMARQLGVTHLAIRARLARHGYMPEVKGLSGHTKYGERRHPLLGVVA